MNIWEAVKDLEDIYKADIIADKFEDPLVVDKYTIESIQDLYNWVTQNIDYYYSDKSDKSRGVQAWDDVLSSKKGHCFEIANLFKHVLKDNDIDCDLYFIAEASADAFGATHTIITVKFKDDIYWIEVSWEDQRGIKKYNSRNKLFNELFNKWDWSNDKYTDFLIFPADEYAPRKGITAYIDKFAKEDKLLKSFKRKDDLKESAVLTEVYPNKGESKKDFIARFMSVTKDEYPDIKQRFAIANSYWERRNNK